MKALTLGLAAVLLVGLTIPFAVAEPDDRPAARDARKPDRDLPAEKRRDAGRTNFTISITATGLDRDNRTYTLEASGEGVGKARQGENRSGLHGFARLHVRILDENGTLVKEGDVRVHVVMIQKDDGVKWELSSFMRTPKGLPKLALRGHNGTVVDDVADLEGHGFALFKPDDAEKRVRLKLDAVVEIAKQ
ncbi:MAG: hypothetical protein HYT80_11240 [Euryarchaeota archaeon]|nr:hypothetical protein [Euryarchaeota archaeon]